MLLAVATKYGQVVSNDADSAVRHSLTPLPLARCFDAVLLVATR
jgi:FMN phosphatase YigB (HAD superfamily)